MCLPSSTVLDELAGSRDELSSLSSCEQEAWLTAWCSCVVGTAGVMFREVDEDIDSQSPGGNIS